MNGCQEVHHRLLHQQVESISSGVTESENKHSKSQDNKFQQGQNVNQRQNVNQSPSEISVVPSTEGEPKQKDNQKNTTMMSDTFENCGNIALRTIPVYLKSGNRKLKVNALLDDASTKAYINADVAAELGLQGHPQKVNVSVLNGQVETFETTPIECALESLGGKSYRI